MRRILTFGAACVLSATAPAATASSTVDPACGREFAPIPSYSVGDSVRQVVSGQFDAGSRPDLATIGVNGLFVSLSAADGTFGAPISSPVFSGDYIAVGDFDGDGKDDLVYAGYQTVGTLIGNGDGTFAQGATEFLDTTFSPAIAVGHFNADAFLDVAVAAGAEGRMFVFLGNGDGSFKPFVEYAAGGGALSIAATDLNGDGKIDLVSANNSRGSLSILIGNGDGTFQDAVDVALNLPADSLVSGVTAFDLDGNGSMDLAIASSAGLIVLLNQGGGNFSTPTTYPSEVYGGLLVVGDFDLDSIPDIVTNGSPSAFTFDTPALVFFRGLGDGTFVKQEVFSTHSTTPSLVAADFNGDGKPDLVTAGDDRFWVLLHVEPGLYDAPVLGYNVFSLTPGSDVTLSDLDGDGHMDALVFGAGVLTVLRGDGTGRFFLRQTISLSYNNDQPAIGQFNPDGYPDIAVGVGDSTVAVLLGLGDGSFADPVLYPIPSTFPLVRTARIDGDAFDDIAVGYQNFPVEAGFHLLLSNGDGTFRDGGTVQSVGTAPRDAVMLDLNADGKTDIVSVDGFSGVSVLLGNGDGTFQGAISYSAGTEPTSVAAGDLTGDHIPDLLVGNVGSLNLSLLPGVGNGTFLPAITLASGVPPQSLTIADLDFDGNADILVTGGIVQTGAFTGIEVYLGLGGGTFQSPQVTELGIRPIFSRVADIDGNGTLDVAYSVEQGYGIVTVFNSVLAASVKPASAIVAGSATLTVSAAGVGSLTYQWRRNGMPLSDGGPISGATTRTLTIDPVEFTDAGSYDVIVTDSCTSAVSITASLSVEFDDVPVNNPFHADILTIATSGITAGCTASSFCPASDVSRAEMAVFLLKSKFGADHVPPPPDPIFLDVPADAFAAAWIDELASLGITAGCGNGNYCPDASASRAEMAVFLLKTLLGSAYVPPPPAGIFADVPADNFAIAWIEDLYNRGITAGCGTSPLRYCPDAAVPREQMAAFLVRTFSIP